MLRVDLPEPDLSDNTKRLMWFQVHIDIVDGKRYFLEPATLDGKGSARCHRSKKVFRGRHRHDPLNPPRMTTEQLARVLSCGLANSSCTVAVSMSRLVHHPYPTGVRRPNSRVII